VRETLSRRLAWCRQFGSQGDVLRDTAGKTPEKMACNTSADNALSTYQPRAKRVTANVEAVVRRVPSVGPLLTAKAGSPGRAVVAGQPMRAASVTAFTHTMTA
jgi:hypothetical protein